MPHLSPLNWVIMSILFWASLLMFTTTMWWQQTPKFPKYTKPQPNHKTMWKWK